MDVDDILQFPESFTITPANDNEYHNQSLLCLTDLEDCCNGRNQRTRCSWYYPNGSEVTFNAGSNNFQRNLRGPNQVIKLMMNNFIFVSIVKAPNRKRSFPV